MKAVALYFIVATAVVGAVPSALFVVYALTGDTQSVREIAWTVSYAIAILLGAGAGWILRGESDDAS